MTTTIAQPRPFEHYAHLYDGLDDFVDVVGSFVGRGLERDDDVIVVCERPRLDALRDLHRPAGDAVTYVDSAATGRNPGSVLSVWSTFLERAAAAGRSVSGVGQPVWDGRTQDELSEVVVNERIVNGMHTEMAGVSILCAYDVRVMSPWLQGEVERHHQLVHRAGTPVRSDRYEPLLVRDALSVPLPPPPAHASPLTFDGADYARLREHVGGLAAEVGLSTDRTEDLVLAVHELATNCVQHGGGSGELRVWVDETSLVAEVTSAGRFEDPLVGRRRPGMLGERGRGLWLVSVLCDLLQLRNTPDGATARAHVRLP